MKFNFFKEKTPPLIGIDISSASIKMVELSDDGRGGYKLEGYSSAPLAKDAMVDGNVGDLEKVADAIKLAWKLLGSREKRVALALPASAVISKKVLMTADLREEDMEAQVEAEANQYIPFSLDEVNRGLKQGGFGRIAKVAQVCQLKDIPLMGTGKTNYRFLDELT